MNNPCDTPSLENAATEHIDEMEGNSVNLVLESPASAMDLEREREIPPNSQDSGLCASSSAATFAGAEGLLCDDPLGDPVSISALQSCSVEPPLPYDCGVTATVPEEQVTAAMHSWPVAKPEVRQTAGAALLKEFDVLYQTYGRRVYRQCLRMLGSHEDAEDVTQEVFLQLYRKADTFRGEASFSTWLHRLTVNTVLMQMRRQRRWRGAVNSLDATPGAEDGANEAQAAVNAMPTPAANPVDRISLEIAMSHLSSGYKEIFILHDVEGYRHEEIAKLLNISEGTSKSQLHKARLRLRTLIGLARGKSASTPPARSRQHFSCPAPCVEELVMA